LNEFIITEHEVLDQLNILNTALSEGWMQIWQSCSKNEGGSLALVKFDMDLAISHHFSGGISLFKSSEVSLFLYSS
jgi:hypothetical protein